ncbi:hypothetical protein JOB18_013559 [Solea senegalensis]|uniref:C-type lectin domain-containing protein n=1 Tax=Solea senegalensis TaxID=28829 RepID=A0AAV6RDH9_SOLSE|nr:hypothetical protein JOB18_013559 [Solea senegalensis]
MLTSVLLLALTLSGIRALPIAARPGSQTTSSLQLDSDSDSGLVPGDDGTPSRFPGQVQRDISDMSRRVAFIRASLGNGFGEMERRHWLNQDLPDDVPAQKIQTGGWVRVELTSDPHLPQGFRQGTEPVHQIPEGFRQGTEPVHQIPEGFRQGTEPVYKISDGFRQGTEPMMSIPEGFRQGTEPIHKIPEGFRQGTEPMMSIPEGFRQGSELVYKIPDGFRQGTEPVHQIPEGFRQGTEPVHQISEGFRQGTEPVHQIPDGFRQGTEPMSIPDVDEVEEPSAFHLPDGFSREPNPFIRSQRVLDREPKQGTEPVHKIPDGFRQGTESMSVPDVDEVEEPSAFHLPEGFRQGTEPMKSIPEGFRQGTEPVKSIPEGFRQGTEPIMSTPDGFRQGTESVHKIPEGFRQGTEPSASMIQTHITSCRGEVINKNCFEFNPTPLTFQDAQVDCRARSLNAELASVTGRDLHDRLVSLVTKGGQRRPVLTWLGGTVKDQKASWEDGSEWNYSVWMPGHPNIHADKRVCVEMFRKDESGWTTVDCEQKSASICSYPVTA